MQTLIVRDFLGIREGVVELDSLTALIGAQASGKSVIARLVYFFNEYFAGFDEIALLKQEHKKTYDSRKKVDFCKLFPQYTWVDDAFVITYRNGLHEVTLTSAAKSENIAFSSSSEVSAYFRELKASFKAFLEGFPESERFAQTRALREFRRIREASDAFKYSSPLFVPAARSFYATIREEIFSILSLDEKIDKIIMQFGEFYESAKLGIQSRDRERPTGVFPSTRTEREYFLSIAKGLYRRSDGRDWIEMSRGRIELSKASSGQQEAVPLLFAISRFPSPGKTLIIEEPEAHLFPESQVEIMDFIVKQAVGRRTSILFTTHSPYLLSALNNHMLRGSKYMERGIAPDKVRAYAIDDGVVRSIVDDEADLISADYIDSVSEKISEDFIRVLEANEQS
jgi:predicted ATPase